MTSCHLSLAAGGWHRPHLVRHVHCRRALGVDGDDLPATTPDQEHPVQPLGQDLEKLHVWAQS